MNWQNIKALPVQFWLSLGVTLCSGTAGSAIIAQVTQLSGPAVASTVAAIFGIIATVSGVVLTVISTQSQLAKTVAAMPGVDALQTNKNASPALIALGADQNVEKVLPPKD